MTSIQGFGSSNYASQTKNVNSIYEKLASGKSINSAKDDPAGLAISDRMDAQLRSLDVAARNANDAISMTQTADGGLSQSTSALQRMRELSVQAGNGIYNAADRNALGQEFSQLQQQLDSIATDTSFNGQSLLDGSLSSGAQFQVGTESGQTVTLSLDSAAAAGLGVDGLSIDTLEGASDAVGAIDEALSTVGTMRGNLGATQSSLESSIETLGEEAVNTASAKSRIADTDYAKEVSELTKASILEQAGVSMQVQKNSMNSNLVLSLLQ